MPKIHGMCPVRYLREFYKSLDFLTNDLDYEEQSIDYLDSVYALATQLCIDPTTLLHFVEER